MAHESIDMIFRILAFAFGAAFVANALYAYWRLSRFARAKAGFHKKLAISEIEIARRVFRPDFESRRAELQELVEMVDEEFGSELSSNRREIYWLRMLVRTLQEEREWLASLLGPAHETQEDQAA